MKIEIYFKDLNQEMQKELIMLVDEETAGSLIPIAYLEVNHDIVNKL